MHMHLFIISLIVANCVLTVFNKDNDDDDDYVNINIVWNIGNDNNNLHHVPKSQLLRVSYIIAELYTTRVAKLTNNIKLFKLPALSALLISICSKVIFVTVNSQSLSIQYFLR